MTAMQMVERAVTHGCKDHASVVKFVLSNYKAKMRPSVAGNLLTQIRKKQQLTRSMPVTEMKRAWAGAMTALKAAENDAGVVATAQPDACTLPTTVVSVEFGEEVVKAVIEVIKKYGYDRVRGAVELSRWFYG